MWGVVDGIVITETLWIIQEADDVVIGLAHQRAIKKALLDCPVALLVGVPDFSEDRSLIILSQLHKRLCRDAACNTNYRAASRECLQVFPAADAP